MTFPFWSLADKCSFRQISRLNGSIYINLVILCQFLQFETYFLYIWVISIRSTLWLLAISFQTRFQSKNFNLFISRLSNDSWQTDANIQHYCVCLECVTHFGIKTPWEVIPFIISGIAEKTTRNTHACVCQHCLHLRRQRWSPINMIFKRWFSNQNLSIKTWINRKG